jgi:hypothetical protein
MNPTKSIFVRGIGWLNEAAWGCVLSNLHGACVTPLDALWRGGDAFGTTAKNAGRFDRNTRLTMAAVALAKRDGTRCGCGGPGRGTGLLGVSRAGSEGSNLAYFLDYLEAGRVLARGSLFIYTLPSSPLAEAAIHFGFEGPMFYVGVNGPETAGLLAAARTTLMDDAPEVLAVQVAESEAIAFWIGQDSAAASQALPLAVVTALVMADEPVAVLAGRLRKALEGNCATCE